MMCSHADALEVNLAQEFCDRSLTTHGASMPTSLAESLALKAVEQQDLIDYTYGVANGRRQVTAYRPIYAGPPDGTLNGMLADDDHPHYALLLTSTGGLEVTAPTQDTVACVMTLRKKGECKKLGEWAAGPPCIKEGGCSMDLESKGYTSTQTYKDKDGAEVKFFWGRAAGSDRIKLGVSVPGQGWAALAVGKEMTNADAVIGGGLKGGGQQSDINAYLMSDYSMEGVNLNAAGTQEITDAEVIYEAGRTYLFFSRPLAALAGGGKAISWAGKSQFLFAYGSGNTIQYHGLNNNYITVDFAAEESWMQPEESGVATPETPTLTALPLVPALGITVSTLAHKGFEQEKTIAPGVFLHWAEPKRRLSGQGSAGTIKLAIDVPGEGWAALGLGADMSDADVVIGGGTLEGGQQSDIAAYLLTGYTPDGINLNAAATAALTDTEVLYEGGRTKVLFTRPIEALGGGKGISWNLDTNMIFAYRSGNTIMYHGASQRSPFKINFAEEKAGGTAAPSPAPVAPGASSGGVLPGFDSVADLSSSVKLHYKLVGDSEIMIAIDVPGSGQWAGLGVGGGMTDADAVIGGGLKSGGQQSDIRAYQLSAAGKGGVNEEAGRTSLLKDTEYLQYNSRTQIKYTRPLKMPSGGKTITYDGDTKLIYAYGGGTTINYHGSNKLALLLNFKTGKATEDTTIRDRKVIHGTLMLLGWGILCPGGTLIAAWSGPRFTAAKKIGFQATLFNAHRIMQCLGLLLSLAGAIYALVEIYDSEQDMPAHGVLGLIVMILGCLMPINAMFRPKHGPGISSPEDHKLRRPWEIMHKNMGRIATVLGLISVILGTLIALEQHEDDTVFSAYYVTSIALLVFFAVAWSVGKIVSRIIAVKAAEENI